ncbi:MAG: hypothetical protein IPI66_06300 [Chitinophagaceae bacterium]|nr:hypothetical protein [Chitinophagaceae bacterium]
MRSLLTITFFCILAQHQGYGQPLDCTRFREGRFRIADSRAGVVTIADRKGGFDRIQRIPQSRGTLQGQLAG